MAAHHRDRRISGPKVQGKGKTRTAVLSKMPKAPNTKAR